MIDTKQEREFYNLNCYNQDLSFDAYIKRRKRGLNRENAITRRVKPYSISIVYNKTEYKSINSLVKQEDKEDGIKFSAFVNRITKILASKDDKRSTEEKIYAALNAKYFESLNLDANHYRRNEIVRKLKRDDITEKERSKLMKKFEKLTKQELKK